MFLNKAYDSSILISNNSVKNKNLLDIAYQAYKLDDTILFKKANTKAYLLSLKLKDSFGVADTYWNYGAFYLKKEKLDSSYYHYNKAHELYSKINHSYYDAKMLYNMAFIQSHLKDYTGSEILLFEAISKFKLLEKKINLYKCYNQLGINYKDLKEYKKAIFYHNKALSFLNKKESHSFYKAGSLNNIGLIHQKLGDHTIAIQYFERALEKRNLELKNPKFYARLIDNIAYNNFLNNQTSKLPDAFYSALKIRNNLSDNPGIVMSKLHLAEYFATIKDTLSAIKYAKQAHSLATEINHNRDKLASLLLLSDIDTKNIATHLKGYITLKDSLQDLERATRNKFTRIRFETDEYILETKRLSLQKIWISVISSIFLIIFILAYLIKRQHSRNKELMLEKKQQKANEEIYELMLKQHTQLEEGRIQERNRISEELHDGALGKLFGTRLGLSFLNVDNSKDFFIKYNSYIDELQQVEKEIRTISHELKNEVLFSRDDFIIIIENLLKKQSKIGMFQYNITYDEKIFWDEIDEKIKINLYRITQEALQNIIKYANAETVELRLFLIQKNLNLSIKDNGIGFNLKKKKKGIGLNNMISRAKKFDGNVSFNSTPNIGTTITISIPIKNIHYDTKI